MCSQRLRCCAASISPMRTSQLPHTAALRAHCASCVCKEALLAARVGDRCGAWVERCGEVAAESWPSACRRIVSSRGHCTLACLACQRPARISHIALRISRLFHDYRCGARVCARPRGGGVRCRDRPLQPTRAAFAHFAVLICGHCAAPSDQEYENVHLAASRANLRRHPL